MLTELDRAEDEAMTQMPQPHPQMPQPIPARQTGMPTQPQAMPVATGPVPVGNPRPIAAPTPMPVQPAMAPQPMPAAPMPGAPMTAQPAQQGTLLDYQGQTPTQATPQSHAIPQSQGMPNPGMQTMSPMGQVSPAQAYAPLDEEGRDQGEKPLPSISVHAFCDRQETAHCVNETTRDWRMKRTNVKIYMGGLPAAIEFYHKENTPSLIMFESGMRGQELFNQLDQLASVCDEGTKVVMIGATNDIRLYRQLMAKGISDYLVPPLHPLHLIRSLGELYADPDQPFVGRVAAFFGVKGGAGSSSLAHNTSWVLSELLNQETALIDMDASWGTTGLDFAYDNTSGLEEALGEPDRLDETLMDRIMIRHTEKLSILPTSGSLNTKPVMETENYEAIVNAVRGISPLAILDMPHYWTDWTTNVLSSVDDVIIVATPDLAGMRNAKNLIDFLKTQRPNDPDPILILNKVGMSKSHEIEVKAFGEMVGMEPNVVLAWDPDSYFECTNEGKMLTDVKTAVQAVEGIKYLANRIRNGSFEVRLKGDLAPTKKGLLKIGGGKAANAETKQMFSFLKKGK